MEASTRMAFLTVLHQLRCGTVLTAFAESISSTFCPQDICLEIKDVSLAAATTRVVQAKSLTIR